MTLSINRTKYLNIKIKGYVFFNYFLAPYPWYATDDRMKTQKKIDNGVTLA